MIKILIINLINASFIRQIFKLNLDILEEYFRNLPNKNKFNYLHCNQTSIKHP